MRYLAAVPVTQPHDYRRNRKRSARVNHHLVIEIEGGKKPACVAELIALHYR